MLNKQKGFTLIEILVVVAVIGILAAIAIPSYTDYLRRGQIQEAFTNLGDFRIRMEQYYQDNRSYANGTACGASNPATANARYFTYACALDTTTGAPTGQSYRMTATGSTSSAVGFGFTINERNTRATTAMPSAWGSLPSDAGSRWVDKKP